MNEAKLSRVGQKWRRLRAWELRGLGWKQEDIAMALGVTQGAVSHWSKRGKEEGVEGWRRSIAKGGELRMSPEQRAQLPVLLSAGAQAFGYRGNVWTGQRVAKELNVP